MGEKARLLKAARDQRAKVAEEARIAKMEEDKKRSEAQSRRKLIWKQIADRIKRKEDDWLKKIFEKKNERKREKMSREKNSDSLKEWHRQRWPIFAAAMQRTKDRQEAREAEEDAVRSYHEQRAIPKKEKSKGK